jgi:hypothetical protein
MGAKLILGLQSSQERLTGSSICQALLTDHGKTPLHLYPSSEQHFITHWGCGAIARVSPYRTQQVQMESNDMQKKVG